MTVGGPAPETVASVRRAGGAVEVPLVAALTAPRTGAVDELLADQDLVVVVVEDPDGPLARIAAAELASHAVRVVAARPLAGPARLLALAGLAGARALGEPLRAAVRSRA